LAITKIDGRVHVFGRFVTLYDQAVVQRDLDIDSRTGTRAAEAKTMCALIGSGKYLLIRSSFSRA
jgi:hypothetical protein